MGIKVLDHSKGCKPIVLGSGMTTRKVFRTIDKELCGAKVFTAGITFFEPGKSSSLHSHPDSEEVNFIVEGKGMVEDGNGKKQPFKAMQYIFIPKGAKHRHHNTGRNTLVLLWMYAPQGKLPRD